MLLIKPKQISGGIMTLIEEADQKVIVVSTYYKVCIRNAGFAFMNSAGET